MQLDARGGLLIAATFNGDTITKHASLTGIGTFSVDPANQVGAASFNTDITLAGVKVGDIIILQPPETLEDTLTFIGASVQAANVVRIRLRASGAVDGAARDWAYLLFSKTEP